MPKNKLWRFKSFLIIATMVLIAVAAMPASAVYFSDSFQATGKNHAPEVLKVFFDVPNIISDSLQKVIANDEGLSEIMQANILGKL